MASDPDRRVPWRHRLTVRLTLGVILTLLLIGCPFLLVFHHLVRQQQLDALAEATDRLSRALSDGIRAAMVAGHPHLLDEAVRNVTRVAEVERVMLLDHRGRVRVTSDPSYADQTLQREQEATCQVCHEAGGAATPASHTSLTRLRGQRVLRSMSTIPNEPQCHECHDARASTNGLLVLDLATSAADRRFFAGIGNTLALGSVMVLLTIAVLVLLLRRTVHRPLQTVVGTSQRITRGDLDARAAVSGSGEFAQLASHVNRMTDHLSDSLRTVEGQRREVQAILDAIDDEIVVLDRQQRVVAANRAFRASRGGNEPIEGKPCGEVSGPHWPCAMDQPDGCPLQRVFESGELHKGIQSRSGADGKERVLEIHASPLRGPDGSVELAVEVRRDISERRQLEAVLAHSEHLASLGLLASGLSHEINNPLGAIATSVEGLRRRLPDTPGIAAEAAQNLEQVLRRIGREVERGRAITHRLLKVARPPGTSRSLVDVNHVVQDIVAILSQDIRRSNIRPRLCLGRDLPPLRTDESRLGQVLMNLTLNAIQAMADRGGELRIVTSSENGALRIEVADTGRGIPAELLKRIYEPFFTTKPVGTGTGLGLFITHRIVSDMRGRLDVRSRPGEGTSFTVRLPFRD